MRNWLKLTANQWKVLASAVSNISQGVILFALAAFFVPETVGLPKDFSRTFAAWVLFWGLLLLLAAVIMSRDIKK